MEAEECDDIYSDDCTPYNINGIKCINDPTIQFHCTKPTCDKLIDQTKCENNKTCEYKNNTCRFILCEDKKSPEDCSN